MSFCIIIHRNSISYAMLESVSTGKGDSDSRTVMLQCETPDISAVTFFITKSLALTEDEPVPEIAISSPLPDIVRFDTPLILASTKLNFPSRTTEELPDTMTDAFPVT